MVGRVETTCQFSAFLTQMAASRSPGKVRKSFQCLCNPRLLISIPPTTRHVCYTQLERSVRPFRFQGLWSSQSSFLASTPTMDATKDVQPQAIPGADAPVKLRSYQHEMLERSLESNVIIVMDTGSGKTHIAIRRVSEELKSCHGDRIVWFMCPSVALCMQQFEVIRE